MHGVIFGTIKGDKRQYVKAKLLAGLDDPGQLSNEALEAAIASLAEEPLPLADVTALKPGNRQQAEIEARKRCASAELRLESPLLPNETIEEDLFTFLTEPVEELRAGTPVLKRTTNRATLYYAFSEFQISPSPMAPYL